MDARIRPATMGDLFWLRLLLGQLVKEEGETAYPHTRTQDLEAMLAVLASRLASEDPMLLCFVAENEKVCVGFVLGDLATRIGEPGQYAQITYLYVVPGWRENAVGRALSTAVISRAKDAGAQALEFLSRPGDQQWHLRGWPIVALVHSLPIDAALASVVPTKVANGHTDHATPEA